MHTRKRVNGLTPATVPCQLTRGQRSWQDTRLYPRAYHARYAVTLATSHLANIVRPTSTQNLAASSTRPFPPWLECLRYSFLRAQRPRPDSNQPYAALNNISAVPFARTILSSAITDFIHPSTVAESVWISIVRNPLHLLPLIHPLQHYVQFIHINVVVIICFSES